MNIIEYSYYVVLYSPCKPLLIYQTPTIPQAWAPFSEPLQSSETHGQTYLQVPRGEIRAEREGR
jgi:hypothetical protein